MISDIKVTSRMSLEMLTHEEIIMENHAIISIKDVDEKEADLFIQSTNKGVLRLSFDDNTEDHPNHINKEQASEIVEFINKINNLDEEVILFVHCTFGISRSAATAAAIMKILGRDDNKIWNDIKFAPNEFVFKSILDAANIFISEEEIDEKVKNNTERWQAELGV